MHLFVHLWPVGRARNRASWADWEPWRDGNQGAPGDLADPPGTHAGRSGDVNWHSGSVSARVSAPAVTVSD
ncbi:hypothetical protein JCM9957A_66710 [Kineosporia succinea]